MGTPDEPTGSEKRSKPAVTDATAAATTSRRGFLGDVGKKAAYVTPIVLTLTARQAVALGSNPSDTPSAACLDPGELCGTDEDCCSGKCTGGVCE